MARKEIMVEENIEEPEEEEKPISGSEKYNLMIFVVTIVVIAAFSFVFYQFFFYPNFINAKINGPYTEKHTYNQYEFKKLGNLWQTEVQINNRLITIPLHYAPWETKYIPLLGRLNTSFDQGPLYVTFDPESSNKSMIALAAGELSLNLARGINRELIAACSKNQTDACLNRPLINCDNKNESVIYLKESIEPSVIFDENCIIIRGNATNLLMAVDRLLFLWYGIDKD
jgi:hypothetical protein